MATPKEKQLAIQILKERIENATGKKVILKENIEDSDIATAVNKISKIILDLIDKTYELEGAVQATKKITLFVEVLNQQLDQDGAGLQIIETEV